MSTAHEGRSIFVLIIRAVRCEKKNDNIDLHATIPKICLRNKRVFGFPRGIPSRFLEVWTNLS